jgi:hypothetical protein
VRRKISEYDVLVQVTKLKRAKSDRVEWDRCFQCGLKMKYKPGLGRFCRVECREAFDSGAKPYAAKRVSDRLAA